MKRISESIISDINHLIKKVNETFDPSPLIDYFKKKDDIFLCSWPNTEDCKPAINNKGIVYQLGDLALLIKKEGFNWMTFMIQNPDSSDFTTVPFIAYNFGIRDFEKREEWNKWLDNRETFTFTRLFFIERLPVQAYSKIFCVRIMRHEQLGFFNDNKDKDLITINVNLRTEMKADINSIYCSDDSDESDEEEPIGEALKNGIENIIQKIQEQKKDYRELLANYIVNMEKFTNLKQDFNYLYAIPVLSSFLYPSTASRSGLYLASKEPILTDTLKKVQEIITQSLCHIDYIRGALIQKDNDVKVITHDLRSLNKKLADNIYDIVQDKNNLDSKIGNIRFLSNIISLLFQILAVNKEGLNDIALPGGIAELLHNNKDWLKILAIKLGEIRGDKEAKINYENGEELLPDRCNEMSVLIGILIVIFNNIWKNLPITTEERVINIHIRQLSYNSETISLTIANKASINPLKRIRRREVNQQGTFAVLSLMNSLIYEEVSINRYFNLAKGEFLNVIHLPKEWLVIGG